MTTAAIRQDEINNAARILGLQGPITSYGQVRKAFSQKVHEADDGKGGFKGDMHAFRRAKETLFAALREKGMSEEEEKRREESLRQKAEEERLSRIREQARQEEENQQHRAREQEEDAQKAAGTEEAQESRDTEDSQGEDEIQEDEIRKAARLIDKQARRRAEEAERAEQTRIKAAIQIEEQLSCIAHSIQEIRAALDAIMS